MNQPRSNFIRIRHNNSECPLAFKLHIIILNARLALKLDIIIVNACLALKLDIIIVNAHLAFNSHIIIVNARLALKLDIIIVNVWCTGCVATRWWISKESYDQNLYSG